jgi:hypothetical protein
MQTRREGVIIEYEGCGCQRSNNHRHRLWLRAGGERPHDSGAAEGQEFAPVQPFTFSLRAISRANLLRFPSAYQRRR